MGKNSEMETLFQYVENGIDETPFQITAGDFLMYSLFFIAVLIIIFAGISLYREHRIKTRHYNELEKNRENFNNTRNLK